MRKEVSYGNFRSKGSDKDVRERRYPGDCLRPCEFSGKKRGICGHCRGIGLREIIGGIDRPTSGDVIVDGKEIYAMSESALAIFRRRNIGIVYQFYNLIPNLTVDENIMLPCLLDNRKPDEQKLSKIVEMTGLSHRRDHLPGELSGGQQQRVSVGRALINDPAFILADEPTGNLDSKAGREIMELLLSANRKANQTLILITHDENIALQADRIITISDGRMIRDEVMRV